MIAYFDAYWILSLKLISVAGQIGLSLTCPQTPNMRKPLKRQSRLQQTNHFATYFLIFEKNKVWHFMRIVCQQTILVEYHDLLIIFEKSAKFEIVVCCKI